MIAGLLVVWFVGCVTDTPEVRPPTSKEMTAGLPAEPSEVPLAIPGPAPGGGPTEMTMHQLRGTPAGVRVNVSGFLSETDGAAPMVSADSEGKTLLLRCDGGSPAGIVRATPVDVTGTTAAHDGDISVLTGCAIAASGDAPVDLDAGGALRHGE